MNKFTRFLLGPEMLWVVYWLIIVVLRKMTHSPVKSMDSFWIASAYIIPLTLLPLSFMLYFVPGVIKPWLLLRLWIAGMVGGHLVLTKALMAHSEQNSGVGTAYIMGIGFVFLVLIAGTIWAVIKF